MSEIVQALYGLTLADPTDNAAKQVLWISGVAKADAEHQHGAWDDESATWDLLLGVLPDDNYASSRKAIAEQNQQYVQMYRLACDLAQEGKKTEAAEQLTRLWQRGYAPYYGDPSPIAPSLGLSVPLTYDDERRLAEERRLMEEVRLAKEKQLMDERRLAEERMAEEMRLAGEIRLRKEKDAANTRDNAKAKLLRDYQGCIKGELEPNKRRIDTISTLTGVWKTGYANDSDRGVLNTLAREGDSQKILDRNARAMLSQFILCGQEYLTAWNAKEAEVACSMQDKYSGRRSDDGWPQVLWIYLILGIVLFANSAFIHSVSQANVIGGIFVGVFIGGVGAIPLALLVTYVVVVPLSQVHRSSRYEQVTALAWKNALACCRKAVTAGNQLLPVYREIYHVRRQQIESERDTAVAAVEDKYQQHQAEIAAEHTRALADIKANYA